MHLYVWSLPATHRPRAPTDAIAVEESEDSVTVFEDLQKIGIQHIQHVVLGLVGHVQAVPDSNIGVRLDMGREVNFLQAALLYRLCIVPITDENEACKKRLHGPWLGFVRGGAGRDGESERQRRGRRTALIMPQHYRDQHHHTHPVLHTHCPHAGCQGNRLLCLML